MKNPLPDGMARLVATLIVISFAAAGPALLVSAAQRPGPNPSSVEQPDKYTWLEDIPANGFPRMAPPCASIARCTGRTWHYWESAWR